MSVDPDLGHAVQADRVVYGRATRPIDLPHDRVPGHARAQASGISSRARVSLTGYRNRVRIG